MYPTLFALFSGTAFFYLGYNYTQIKQELQKPKKVLIRPPNHTFFPETINQYTEKRQQQNKFIIYSRLHQCPLSTHELINKQTIELEKKITDEKVQQSVINQQTTSVNEVAPQQKGEEKVQIIKVKEHKNQLLFERIYKDYARQLVNNNTCNSVELIYGPIFSKDTPYKQKGEIVRNIYTSTIKVGDAGEWITDRFYTIVVCNRNEKSYFNGFAYRKSNYPTFRFLNYLTSMKKLEEQTGLVFNINGEQLTRIDYAGINQERLFDPQQQQQQQAPENSNQQAST